jgi:aspartate racemase
MKTIGLLGGTGWSSTIYYYTLLNQLVNQRLGEEHSAEILLRSIDYNDIKSRYGKDHDLIAQILKQRLAQLMALSPDCLLICCNSLHKYYDLIKTELNSTIPIFHAVELTAQMLKQQHYNTVLLLATKFTMQDGFFANILQNAGITVVLPNIDEQNKMQVIHDELMNNQVTDSARQYFHDLIAKNNHCDAVVLGCTEYPLVVDSKTSPLPVIDPVKIQTAHAVDFALV